MKLREIVRVATKMSDLQATLAFYAKLGFKEVDEGFDQQTTVLLGDGMIAVSVRRGDEPRTELTYFTSQIDEKIAGLVEAGIEFDNEEGGALFRDPSGMPMRIVRADTLEMHKPFGEPWSKLGRFYELSCEVRDLDEAIEFWQRVGFEIEQRASPAATFATLNDGVLRLGVYKQGTCLHKFKNPSITYFEPEMDDRIRQLKDDGIEFLEKLPGSNGKVEEAIAESPDGQLFFLFHYDW